ncbi:MAG: (Fe-S)-binding protein [Planctomycetes bacterium]|nr:(Fe-S)-binding protein [Planctomycetota bacterium]
MNVSLMVTCLGDALFPEVGVATVRLLQRLGVAVDFPPAQTCCGQPHFNSGYRPEARELAKHTLKTFAGSSLVVTPSGSCAAMVKLEYPELFQEDRTWRARAEDLAQRVHELSDFLVNVLQVEDVGARFEGKVTYHMACHLRGLGLLTEPERLLRRVKGLDLIPLERSDECCGFGGSFSVRFPGISGAMVHDKAALIEQTGADVVVATDAGCLMNIGGYLRRRNSKVRTMHLAEVLEKT